MPLTENAVQVLTAMTSTAGKVAGVMTSGALADGITVATNGATLASSVNATMEAQTLNLIATRLREIKSELEGYYATLKQRVDVYNEINGIT